MNTNIGTYACLNLSLNSAEELQQWAMQHEIPMDNNLADLHCTVLYSRKNVDGLAKWKLKLPVSTLITGWKIFGVKQPCLVATFDDPRLQRLHSRIRTELGATHDFSKYVPHLTICEDYFGSLPKEIPNFKLFFNKFTVEPLDLDK